MIQQENNMEVVRQRFKDGTYNSRDLQTLLTFYDAISEQLKLCHAAAAVHSLQDSNDSYLHDVKCDNCRHHQQISIKKGVTIEQWYKEQQAVKCSRCGCSGQLHGSRTI